MYMPSVLYLLLVLTGEVLAFHGGGFLHGNDFRLHRRTAGLHNENTNVFACWPAQPCQRTNNAMRRRASRTPTTRLRESEYEAFFNKASKSGGAVIRTLDPEERARRALEGEKLEDEIIEIATELREKADAMVADTGSINFEVIQPMIDQISVLKGKYKLVVGASIPENEEESADPGEDSGGAS